MLILKTGLEQAHTSNYDQAWQDFNESLKIWVNLKLIR